MFSRAFRKQRTAGGRSLTAEEVEEVRDQVWRQLVAQFSLESEFEQRGITARADEIALAIQESPPQQLLTQPEFQTDGKFDITKWQRWLGSSAGAQYLPYLQAQYDGEIRRSKLLRVVTGDVYVSDAGLGQAWQDANQKATIEATPTIPRNAVPDSVVEVSEQEARAYYEAHQDDFKRPATAYMSYVSLHEAGRLRKVGVNCYRVDEEQQHKVEFHPYREDDARAQVASLQRMRAQRDAEAVRAALDRVGADARSGFNLMPAITAAVKAYASVGEITREMIGVFGRYREPIRF